MKYLRRHTRSLPYTSQKFIAAFEGLEGGFAIGASVLAGLSFASLDKRILIMSAVISIIVNGFNSATVKYSSEHYLDELDGHETHHPFDRYFVPALFEFFAYFAISLFAILPVLLMENVRHGIAIACGLTIVILFAAGYWRAKMLNMHPWKDACETALLGTGIIVVGYTAGSVISQLA